MSSALIFPDGIRLARQDEIPGPQPSRSNAWAKVQSAKIASGFILRPGGENRFTHYAEINVDAPRLWDVFRDLCQALLGPQVTLIASRIDDAPVSVGSANSSLVFAVLEPHQYQLAHDGYLQFGLVADQAGALNEVFVVPTKHLNVWLNDEGRFRSVMRKHDLREANSLEFLDQYPRATVALPADRVVFSDAGELIKKLASEIGV